MLCVHCLPIVFGTAVCFYNRKGAEYAKINVFIDIENYDLIIDIKITNYLKAWIPVMSKPVINK